MFTGSIYANEKLSWRKINQLAKAKLALQARIKKRAEELEEEQQDEAEEEEESDEQIDEGMAGRDSFFFDQAGLDRKRASTEVNGLRQQQSIKVSQIEEDLPNREHSEFMIDQDENNDDDYARLNDKDEDESQVSGGSNKAEESDCMKKCKSCLKTLKRVFLLLFFDIAFLAFIATQELNDTSHLAKINMMTRFNRTTILKASLIAQTFMNLATIGVAYAVRGCCLSLTEAQYITMISFFFICAYEMIAHTISQLMSYFDLWTGPMTGAVTMPVLNKTVAIAVDAALNDL